MEGLEQYHLEWHALCNSDRGAVPLGSGEVGISLWVTEAGLQFYIARSDAMTETDRNVKLGKVTLALEPNPFSKTLPFTQRLNLRDGCVEVQAGEKGSAVKITVFVDRGSDVVYLSAASDKPLDVRVHYHNWRATERPAPGQGAYDCPDVLEALENAVLFYHQNGETMVRETAEIEALAPYVDVIQDTLGGRIFGGVIGGEGFVPRNGVLERKMTTDFVLRVATMSRQDLPLLAWKDRMTGLFEQASEVGVAMDRTRKWWNSYWEQSYIWVDGDAPGTPSYAEGLTDYVSEVPEALPGRSAITRGYVHSKYMFACCAGGRFPIIFNGALFNLMPGAGEHIDLRSIGRVLTAPPAGEPNAELNPDERPWGHCTLWQNQRLPYHALLGRGEYEAVRALFAHYRRFWDINRIKARVYYDGEGQYNTEITTSFGLIPLGAYGTDRRAKPDGYAANRAGGGVEYSPGLELVLMMLDYYNHTRDEAFLRDEVIPFAKDILRGIETRFTRRENGKMVLQPLNSVESFRDCKNPVSVVAGIHAVLDRLGALEGLPEEDAAYFTGYREIVPDIRLAPHPLGYRYEPAEEYAEQRNVEPVWMNPVFPYRMATKFRGDYQTGYNTYHFCEHQREGAFQPYAIGTYPLYNCYSGWQYVGMAAALLGLADDCAEIVANNCALNNPGHKYPAMWGPCYDSVPDIDHSANLQTTLQMMLLQAEGDRIYLLPAWKPEWNVHFKLPAPKGTTVECRYENGVIQALTVTPEWRRADVEICLKPFALC